MKSSILCLTLWKGSNTSHLYRQKKKERRSFGLAMQKVKDRRNKLQQRQDDKEVKLEQVEEAEKHKRQALFGNSINDDSSDSSPSDDENAELKHPVLDSENAVSSTTASFHDNLTKSQFGGQVIVTTQFGFPEEIEDIEEGRQQPTKTSKHVDIDQKYAGSVKKYMKQIKGKLPSKKQKRQNNNISRGGKKGKHGAVGMQGMGNAQDLKMAQKILRAKQSRSGGGKDRSLKKKNRKK